MFQYSKFWLLLSFLCIWTIASTAQKEKDYSDAFQKTLGGQREYAVTSGYVDLLTETHAIEVEYANKWKQAIGQALWYGQQTLKKPGIILILRTKSDYKYFIQLNTALEYGGLTDKIKVWLYPNDFPNLTVSNSPNSSLTRKSFNPPNKGNKIVPATSSFWLTKSSGIRHNASCRYYKNTRGRSCQNDEGRACKKCGG
ncbi:MAG: hypothetical protein AAF960_19585 [Bacteroidota bacterium]